MGARVFRRRASWSPVCPRSRCAARSCLPATGRGCSRSPRSSSAHARPPVPRRSASATSAAYGAGEPDPARPRPSPAAGPPPEQRFERRAGQSSPGGHHFLSTAQWTARVRTRARRRNVPSSRGAKAAGLKSRTCIRNRMVVDVTEGRNGRAAQASASDSSVPTGGRAAVLATPGGGGGPVDPASLAKHVARSDV